MFEGGACEGGGEHLTGLVNDETFEGQCVRPQES